MSDPLEAVVEVPCVACGSDARRVLRTREQLDAELDLLRRFHVRRLARRVRGALQERASFTHDYPARIVSCAVCGLLYRTPRPQADDIREAYEEERYGEERLEQLDRSQLDSFRRKARALARGLAPGARVLEAGSFVGGFLEAAAEVGLDAMGLDPSEQLARRARRRGLRVERATLDEFAAGAPGGSWAAICIWNTFDQVPHPGPLLEAVAKLLAHDGVLVLRVPNGAVYRDWAQRAHRPVARRAFAGLAWNNLIGFPYLFGYSRPSLDALLARHGFVRCELCGDTLCILADRDYAAWARVEEVLWKTAQQIRARRSPMTAPWLDVLYRAAPDA